MSLTLRAGCGCPNRFPTDWSCKGRGNCPSCNTERMAEIAAHLVDHVFPQVPVRQSVLSLPKRLRYFLLQEAGLIDPVPGIFLQEGEAALRSCSPDAPINARLGAVTLFHRFGSALSANLHADEIPPCISSFGSLARSQSAPGRLVTVVPSTRCSARRTMVYGCIRPS
ncbi:MAG: transposase zinc-binding domain-containing protein [Methylococcales bacterium]